MSTPPRPRSCWPRSTTPRARSSHDNLTADGYRVLVAPDRAKALALLCTAHPDLILVDVNGQTLELLDAVRSGEGLAGRADPGHADDRAEPRRRPAAADPAARARRRRRRQEAVRLPGAARPDRARCCGARRRRGAARGSLRAGPIVIDVRSREVRVCDRPVELSAKEYRAAGHARRRAAPGVHPRGAVARRLGLRDVRAHPDARQPRVPAAPQAVRRRRRAGWWSTCGASATGCAIRTRSARSDERRDATPRSVDGALPAAGRRARRRGAGGARARAHASSGCSPQSAAALEDAAGALLHAATTFIALDGPLPGLFAEQAGALLAVAARFEEAADLTPRRADPTDAKEEPMRRTRDRELPRRRRRPARARRAPDRRRRLAGARHRRHGDTARVDRRRSTGDQDGRPQAEAIARDYLTTVGAHEPGAGPAAGEPIPEQGGSDARSHRRPRPAPRQHRARAGCAAASGSLTDASSPARSRRSATARCSSASCTSRRTGWSSSPPAPAATGGCRSRPAGAPTTSCPADGAGGGDWLAALLALAARHAEPGRGGVPRPGRAGGGARRQARGQRDPLAVGRRRPARPAAGAVGVPRRAPVPPARREQRLGRRARLLEARPAAAGDARDRGDRRAGRADRARATCG